MVLVHHLFDVIVDVQLGTAIDDVLYLGEQLVHVDTLRTGDVIEGDLAVDALYERHLELHLVICHRAHPQVLEAFDAVLLTVTGDEVAELLAVTLGLAHTHAAYVLQFLDGDGIGGGHILERRILKDDIGGHIVTGGHLATQVFEHSQQGLVEHRGAAARGLGIVVKLVVLGNLERDGRHQEAATLLGNLEQAVVLHFLLDIAGNHGLAKKCVPEGSLVLVAAAETFDFLVSVGQHLVGLAAKEDVDDIVHLEVLLDFQDDAQSLQELHRGFDTLLRVQAIVTVLTVVMGIFLTKVVQQELATADR